MTTKTGHIYTLTDPRDRTIRYVGQTKQALDARLVGHVTGPTNPAMRIWINKLVKRGLTPRIASIATVPVSELDAEEKCQILKHVEAGHRLLNGPYYKTNMGDLLGAGDPRTRARETKDRSREMFGAIAAARAAGTMTRLVAVPRILLRVPIVTALLTWDVAWGSRVSRRSMQAGVALYGAWALGFDLLMRRFILSYIPQDRVLAFWHAYLARPMAHLGILVAASFLMAGWMEYLQAAGEAGVPSLLGDPKNPARNNARA